MKASKNPMLVMVDEETGEKYARVVAKKGTSDMDWIIKDMSKELKSWGDAGGPEGYMILKSDGEHSLGDVKGALATFHGGRISPEKAARGESQSNGVVEEAGKTVRGFGRILKYQLEEKAGMKLDEAECVTLWLIRWAAMITPGM